MKGLEIQYAANRIANDYVRSGKSMNSGIAKIAQENGLREEQIKRLIEESNKATFMAGFEKNGEQVFDVASLAEVKEAMAGKMEKKASVEIKPVEFSDERYRSMLGNWNPASIEKTASENPEVSANQEAVIGALTKLAEAHDSTLLEIQRLESLGFSRYGKNDVDYLTKTAAASKDDDFVTLGSLIKTAASLREQHELIFEKYATVMGAVGSVVNTGLSVPLNAATWVAKKVGGAALGLTGKAVVGGATVAVPLLARTVSKHPGHALNVVTMGPHAAHGVREAATKNAKHWSGPAAEALEDADKEMAKAAAISALGLQHTVDIVAGAAAGLGGIFGGLLGAAAKKLGGGIAITMNNREFDRSFDTIMSRNPDLKDRKSQMREYFDVVSRHSPTIAKDPIAAEGMVKNFDAFGGIDFNTIKSMNELEATNKRAQSPLGTFAPFKSIGSHLG